MRKAIAICIFILLELMISCKTQPVNEVVEPASTQVNLPESTESVQPPTETGAPTNSPLPTSTPEPTATPTYIPPTAIPIPLTVDEILANLVGLPLDEFYEESMLQMLLRSPETITYMGIADELGMRNDQLDDISDAYLHETQRLESGILDLLHSYDPGSLTPEERISYAVYEWYLDDLVRGHPFMYHNYPLHYYIRSYHFNIENLFQEGHPLETRENAEDFIARLNQVNQQVDQLIEGLKIREELGIIPPRFIIQLTRSALLNSLGLITLSTENPDPRKIQLYQRFKEGVLEIEGLTDTEIEAFDNDVLEALEKSYIPAFMKMLAYEDYVIDLADYEAGVWKLPDGDAYYAYLLQKETSTNLSPQEIHEIGLAEVERIHDEMRAAFTEMGYPEDASLGELFSRAVNEAGYFNITSQSGQDAYVAAVEKTIAEVDARVSEVFDLRPKGQLIVIAGNYGGFYNPGSADGSRPGSYHVSVGGQQKTKYDLQTIAYHEAIPGHHYQIALAQELDLPTFRNEVSFNGFTEGWALYAERLAWEIGMYEDNPYGNIGRLQLELLRAVRLVTDTGIHAMGWTRNEAIQYMEEAMNSQGGWFSSEVDRYIVLPAQATGYKIGMIKILELRQKVQTALGDQFDIKEFHNLIIGHGSLPLEILEQIVNDYIEAKLES